MYQVISKIDIHSFPKGSISRVWLQITENGLHEDIRIPVIIARGEKAGKTMGITAALHGNELNGIPVVQRLFKESRMPNRDSGEKSKRKYRVKVNRQYAFST